MKHVLAVLLFVFSLTVYPDNFNIYDELFVTNFPAGEGDESFRFLEFPNPMDLEGPNCLGFDEKGRLYICDTWQNRIVILTEDFTFEKTIALSSSMQIGTSQQLFITSGGIWGHKGGRYFEMLSHSGDPLFYLDLVETAWNNKIQRGNFLLEENNLILFLKTGEPVLFKNMGLDNRINLENVITPDSLEGIVTAVNEDWQLENNRVLLNEDVISRDFSTLTSYWQEKKGRSAIAADNWDWDYLQKYYKSNSFFLGKDTDQNYYWYNNRCVIVFTSTGQILDNFSVSGYPKVRTIPALHPSGDIYFLNFDSKRIYLFKISRVW